MDLYNLDQNEKNQLLCTLSTFFLYDNNNDINKDNIKKVIDKSGNNCDENWINLFSNNIDINNLDNLLNVDPSSDLDNISSAINDNNFDNEKEDLETKDDFN